MARQRMYLFERAYVNYGNYLRKFGATLWKISGNIWRWCWSGPGANFFEVILRICVVIGAIALCVLYVRYEISHGRGFTLGMFGAIVVIFVFALIVLWGWKAPVHVASRVVSGASASGLILTLSALMLAVALVVFSVYLLVLFLLTTLSFFIFLPMRFAHWLWLLYRRIAYRCPYEDDSGAHGLPIHICICGQQYEDLQPSFYGIFYHTCRHGDQDVKLPTMDFLGRNKLHRLCRGCKRPLIFSEIGELPERPIVVVGGPTAGKTVLLRQAVRQLRERIGALPGATVFICSEEQERELGQDLALLDRGQVVAKTIGYVTEAFGLAVRIPEQIRALLYLYDAPGEDYLTMKQFGQKQVVQHLAGIILLVDPFSLPLLSDHAHRLGDALKPSGALFHDVVAVLINGVNQMLVNRPNDKCDIPLAIVMSKVDALPVYEFPYLNNLWPSKEHPLDSAHHARCRDALEELGEGRSIRALEHKFSNVQYFASSALGRMPDWRDNTPFHPVGVVEPFLWLLGMDGNDNL